MFFDIITINYNNDIGLNRTLTSIFQQNFKDFRVIVIDGNSNDKSIEVVKSFDSRKICMISEDDKGIYDAMNKGLEYSEAKYFFYLNSGDIFSDKYVLQTMYTTLADGKYDLAYGGLTFYNKENKIVREWLPSRYSRMKMYMGWMPPHPGFTLSRSHVASNEIKFDDSLKIAGDFGFMLECFKKTKPDRIANYNKLLISMEAGGISNKSLKSILRSNLEVQIVWKKYLPIYPIWIFLLKPLSKVSNG